jgi:hypothetical protein
VLRATPGPDIPEISFRDINLGFSSAETERAEAPELLRDGFLDYNAVSEKALDGPVFLFLGYKGSGKSAIAERLSLLAESEYDQFVAIVNLADFPFTTFSKIIRGDIEPSGPSCISGGCQCVAKCRILAECRFEEIGSGQLQKDIQAYNSEAV